MAKSKRSAGVLLYRRRGGRLEALLAHPGGPFWLRRDKGAWSIPKGEIEDGEDPEAAAVREFGEETGFCLAGPLTPLGVFRQRSGKNVWAFACEGDVDPARIVSNLCQIEWPPRSGRMLDIPEIDRAAWFALPEAAIRIVEGQRPMLDALERADAEGRLR